MRASFVKSSADIFVTDCDAVRTSSELFPREVHPAAWKSCQDAYELTWLRDPAGQIVRLSSRDRLALAYSMGFCPHMRCQLGNLSHSSENGQCPHGLCYTKLENGGRSFGACCFLDGVFDSGDLIGVFNKTQPVPKPIYRHSRVTLQPDESFINANVVHPGVIITQCPMANTLQDVVAMIGQENVSLWVQLSPKNKIYSQDDAETNSLIDCQLLSNALKPATPAQSPQSQSPFLYNKLQLPSPSRRTVDFIWYPGWRDFGVPSLDDEAVSEHRRTSSAAGNIHWATDSGCRSCAGSSTAPLKSFKRTAQSS